MSNMGGGESEQENILELMPISSCQSNGKQLMDYSLRDYTRAKGNDNPPIAQPIYRHWGSSSKRTAYSHVVSVPTRYAGIHSRTSSRDIPEGIPPMNSLQTRPTTTHSYNAKDVVEGFSPRGVYELQQGLSLNNGIGNRLDTGYSYRDIHALDVKPPMHMLSRNNDKGQMNFSRCLQSDQNEVFEGENGYNAYARAVKEQENHLSSHGQRDALNKLSHSSRRLESNGAIPNSWRTPTVTVAGQGFRSRQEVPSRSCLASRLRRARISERLQLLRELLPYSEQGNKESVMDDAVDYIKYLQLQIKTLSQNTLGGEPTEDPFINLEGFGHYLLNQEKLTEPFEEVIGKLMEDNKPAFIQLLESKGLSVMPMALAGGLFQAM